MRATLDEPVRRSGFVRALRGTFGAAVVLAAATAAAVAGTAFGGNPSPSPAQHDVAQSQPSRPAAASERVSLLARPTVHGRNQFVTLLGSIDSNRSGEDIDIEGRECGQTAFKVVGGAHTGQGGGWTVEYGQAITTTLRARWKNARSATVTIPERAWVQLSTRPRTPEGFGFGVAVRSKLQFWKRFVIVQRFERSAAKWTDVKRVVLTKTGAAPGSSFVWASGRFRVRVPKRTLIRAVFPLAQARPCYITGYSNQLRT